MKLKTLEAELRRVIEQKDLEIQELLDQRKDEQLTAAENEQLKKQLQNAREDRSLAQGQLMDL